MDAQVLGKLLHVLVNVQERDLSMKLLSTARVAEMMGLSPSTLRYWRSQNEGPPSFQVGRSVKYYEDDIQAWLELRKEATGKGVNTPAHTSA